MSSNKRIARQKQPIIHRTGEQAYEVYAAHYYPYHAARADLLRCMDQYEAAAEAYQRAIDLCQNRTERAYLQQRLDEMLSSR
jgi:RNA polymerase sigma-70 factor (ECF subfamily)